MVALRDALVYLAVASAAEMFLINTFAPQLALADRFSRSILRYFLLNAALYVGYAVWVYPFFLSPLRDLPGPKGGNLFWGHGPQQMAKPPGSTALRWIKTVPNGGLLRFRGFFNIERLIPTSPDTLKAILSEHTYDWEKPAPVRNFLVRVLGAGLILVEGNEHRFQRKHLLPAFQVKQIRDLYPVFWEKARGMVEGIEAQIAEGGKDTVVEFGDWATRVTLDIIGVAGMGKDFKALKNPDDELVQAYEELLEPTKEKAIYFAVNVVLPMWFVKLLPWKLNALLAKLSGDLKQYALNLVHERQKSISAKQGLDGSDILTLLVKSNDFKDTELAEQLLTFLAAGHETTSSALTWALYLMATNPGYQQRVREEIRQHLPTLQTIPGPTPAQIEELPFLNAICNETLRLYPTVPVTIRQAIKDTTLPVKVDGKVVERAIPKGTPALLVPWAINRSPLIWGDDADRFVPERWLGEGRANTGGATSNYAQITFLHGPRSCIGQGFAKAEFKCLAAAVLGRFEVQMADPNENVYPAGVITTKPANGMHLKMKSLSGW